MNKMECPACKNKISIFHLSKIFKCKTCGQLLKIKNNGISLFTFFGTWLCISGAAYLSDVDSAVLIDVFIAPILAFTMYWLVIKIDIETKENDRKTT